jgi:lipoprotein-releasing system permease protein
VTAYFGAAMSRLPFELMLALRYLRPKRTFVSIITLICVIGVMLGVAVLIIVLSVMSGFDHDLKEKVFGFKSHLTITTPQRRVSDWKKLASVVSSNQMVKGAAPFVMGQAMVAPEPSSGDQFAAQIIRGIDPKTEGAISIIPKSVVSGEFNLRGNRILLGQVFAREMGIFPGDRVSIYSPRDLKKMKDARDKDESEAIVPGDYQVAGIFDVGYFEFNAGFVITSLATAQDLFDLDEDVNGLKVMLHDPSAAEEARMQLGRTLGPGTFITTWFEESSAFLDAIIVEKNLMFYINFVIMIVAAFGITSAQITFVVQKTREIGMLKALGATSRQIMTIFLFQSFVVGVIGVISGYGLGRLGVAYRNEFLHTMRRLFGFELFPPSIYQFSELPAIINPHDVAVICGGSLIICVLAGLLPAWNAGRLKPVEALRYE